MMRNTIPPVVAVLMIFLTWEIVHAQFGAGSVSSPLETISRLLTLMEGRRFWNDVSETGYAFAIALIASIVIGIVIGTILGSNRLSAEVFEPILISFYALPKVMLYPIVLLFFGLGSSARIAFGIMHGLIPIVLLTKNAITQIKPVYFQTARVMHLGTFETATRIILPAVLPELVSGIRISFSLSLLGVLIGEMFAAKRGLGFSAMNAMGLGDISTILAIGLFIAVFAISANVALLAVERLARYRS